MSFSSTTSRNNYVGNNSTATYNYTFRILANTDLRVTVRDTSNVETELALTTDYTVSGVGASGGGSITLVAGNLASGYVLSIRRVLEIVQETDIRNQGAFFPEVHEDQFDRNIMISQQQQDELDRSLKLSETVNPADFNPSLPAELADNPGATVIVNTTGDGFSLGPTADSISSASADAAAAAASAASSAASAATAIAASSYSLWNDVVYLTFADTPYSIVDASSGVLYEVDCTSGNVVVNLPLISGLTLSGPWSFGIKKTDSSANTITINRNSTDTIDGNTSLVISKQNYGVTLVPDVGASPDKWTSMGFGQLAISGDVVGTTDSQVLTNKDIDGGTASNTSRITLPKAAKTTLDGLTRKQGTILFDTTSNRPYYDNGSTLSLIGSGSGGSGRNYLDSNPDAEVGTTGWATYADAAASSPVDGTGGSASITWTQSSSSPLRGSNSFLLTKDAANRQGNGVSFDFTIDSADKAKVLQCSFEYAISSGTYVDDDLTVWVYDVTNSTLIQPAPYKLKNHSLAAERFFCEFQSSASSTSYRLILHVSSTSASAYTLKFDNFNCGPQAKMYGSAITDWVSWTPTGSLSTNVNYYGWYRKIGDSLHLYGTISFSGANTQGVVSVNLPNSWQLDTNKFTSSAVTRQVFGAARIYDSSTDQTFDSVVIFDSATAIRFSRGDTTAGSAVDSSLNRPITFATNDTISFSAVVPISGWSSSQLISSDANTRPVVARYTSSSSSAMPNSATIFDFSTKSIDTHNAVTTGASWKFTAPVYGFYLVSAQINYTASANPSRNDLLIRKNGSTIKSFFVTTGSATVETNNGSEIIELNAGDYIDVQNFETVDGGSYVNTHSIFIQKIDGPSQILASETVAARYYSTAGTTIPTTEADYIPATKSYDYTNSYTAGVGFTCPVSGLYLVNIQFITATYSTASLLTARVRVDSTDYANSVTVVPTGVSGNYTVRASALVRCLAGQVIKGRHLTSAGTPAQDGNANSNFIEISRVGNY